VTVERAKYKTVENGRHRCDTRFHEAVKLLPVFKLGGKIGERETISVTLLAEKRGCRVRVNKRTVTKE